MMSFKLTIEVPDSKLMKTLRLLNGQKVYVESTEQYKSDGDDPRKKTTRTYSRSPRMDALLTMTGKKAQANTKIAKAVDLFELLEADKGVGTINVSEFRTELVRRQMPKAMQQRCVTEKFLSYL